jgi:gliding motility-associated-like protein
MKKGLLLGILICCSLISLADHIKGGWIYYEYAGPGATPNTHRYKITAKVYRDCANNDPNHPQNSSTAVFTIFAGTSNTIVQNIGTAPRTAFYQLKKNTNNPCMSNPPVVCYLILQYEFTVELPATPQGYTIAYQRCCRIAGIQNLAAPSNQWGNTYTVQIPGDAQGAAFPVNSTPKFIEADTAIICFNAPFTLDYNATDANSDSLSYSICSALHGGDNSANTGQGVGAAPNPSAAPPYTSVGYKVPYTASDPFATGISINSQGLITGIAPAIPGEYVISVCVSEYRQGILLNTVRKELHVIVGNCTLAGAELNPTYITCDGFGYTFQNEISSTNITNYAWNFGDPGSGVNNSSSAPKPSHNFSDTGKFTVKLKVTNALGCQDSAQTLMSVYPGFKVGFITTGNCFQSPFNFTDTTKTSYGVVDSWRWDFGETTVTNDTSIVQNPSYLYPSAGTRTVRLIATNSKGCIDTVTNNINVRANPLLDLPFHDTLICSIDNLPLLANGTGNFSWVSQPTDPTLTNPNAQNPQVSPDDTTVYIVTLNDNGCIKKDTITVNVLTYITVDIGIDTGMCRTDTIIMKTNSHALSYQWSPAAGLSSTTVKYPQVFPDVTTTYYVKANLGLCPAYDTITIQVAPYPQADAGSGTTICYGEKTQLNANYVGTGFAWSPTNTLQNPNSLTPFAGPMQTTAYIFTAFSTGVCPKPKSDTALVIVRPQVKAFAGNDTSVTALQPLQLNATGGLHYSWSPAIGLNNTAIANPIAVLSPNIDSIIYKVRVSDTAGCFADDDIKVIVFKTGPEIFIPSAFTPNSDGRNEIARPVLVGMQALNYFRVYNRWGQMVYSTSEVGKGWDGTFGGKPQPSGTYVYAAQAVDYTGKIAFRKGTIVLIR